MRIPPLDSEKLLNRRPVEQSGLIGLLEEEDDLRKALKPFNWARDEVTLLP